MPILRVVSEAAGTSFMRKTLAQASSLARAWRGLWVSFGAAGALVLGLFRALALVLSTCGS
jgi:hypothetical protein